MTNSNASLSVSLPAISYQGLPVVTTELLAQAYDCPVDHIRRNFNRNREHFVEGKHYFTLSGNELKSFTNLCGSICPSQISAKIRKLTLWTERGCARHAKMLTTDKAWEVFELMEDTFFNVQAQKQQVQQAQPQKPVYNLPPTQHTMIPEATITPADQNILQAIVRAKVSMLPNSQKKKSHYFALHWMKFNDHFRLGKYDQLPQSKMADAVIFLVTLDVLSPDKPTNMDGLDKFDRWAWKVEILRRQVQEAVSDLAQEGVFLLKVEDTGLAPFMWLVQVLRDWLQKVVASVSNVIGDKYPAHYKMIELIRSLEIRLQAPGNRWGIDFK